MINSTSNDELPNHRSDIPLYTQVSPALRGLAALEASVEFSFPQSVFFFKSLLGFDSRRVHCSITQALVHADS